MAGVAVAALVLLTFEWGYERLIAAMVISLLVLGWFIGNWLKEFVFVMGLRDDDFPGRHDKLIWVLVLLILAPIGLWFFRSYRLAHWPTPEAGTLSQVHPIAEGGTATLPV
jgi:hypothetical protein